MNRKLCSLVFVLALGCHLAGPRMSAALPRDPGPPPKLLDVPRLVEALEAPDIRARLNAAEALGFLDYSIDDEATARSVAPKWIGLFAKNSAVGDVSEIDASFDVFEVWAPPPRRAVSR